MIDWLIDLENWTELNLVRSFQVKQAETNKQINKQSKDKRLNNAF